MSQLGRKGRGIILAAMLFAGGACATSSFEARGDALAPFTVELRDSQPDGAVVAVYEPRGAVLVWIAAEHAMRTDSQTFRLINEAYREFDFDTVIVEGCPTSWGPNAERLIKYAKAGAEKEANLFQPHGETVPSVLEQVSRALAREVCSCPEV
jgi:hypothetical protein